MNYVKLPECMSANAQLLLLCMLRSMAGHLLVNDEQSMLLYS